MKGKKVETSLVTPEAMKTGVKTETSSTYSNVDKGAKIRIEKEHNIRKAPVDHGYGIEERL